VSTSDTVSEITESFGNKSEHVCSSETAKDCLATVSKNSSLETAHGNESSATTELFGNESTHACSLETAKDCLATVSEISVKNANRVITLHQNASWKTTMYFVMVTALLTSCTIEVQGDLLSITNEDCTNTGENTEQWKDLRTGTAEKISCTAFPVQLDKTQQQRSVKLHQCHTQH
jgi:hypothetical protein